MAWKSPKIFFVGSQEQGMARGMGEPPERSPGAILQYVEYPVSPQDLADTAADMGAPVETIRFLGSLPGKEYRSADEVERDFAEADARFGMGTANVHHRGNIGKEATEPGSGSGAGRPGVG